jgi:hypothetical protein
MLFTIFGRGVREQGCQINLGTSNHKGIKIPKWQQNIPNVHKIYGEAIK